MGSNSKVQASKYEHLTYEEYVTYIYKLLRKVKKDCEAQNLKYDYIIALRRGGLFPGLVFSHELKDAQLEIVDPKLYERFLERDVFPNHSPLGKPLDIMRFKDKNILVVDDISDTGETLLTVSKYLRLCECSELRSATVYMNKKSKVIPSFYCLKTTKWVVFPYESKPKE